MHTAIVGSGKVGTAVGILLQRQGYLITGIYSRTRKTAEKSARWLKSRIYEDPAEASRKAELVLLTTTDAAIAFMAKRIAETGGFRSGQTVVHMSGLLTSKVLAPAAGQGAHTLSIHPLQSCASVERGLENLPHSVFSIEGDVEAYSVAERIVKDLGGEFFYISQQVKPLYHAAACVASNYLVSLIDMARCMIEKAGMPPELGARALQSLIEGTMQNIDALGIPAALTGPISRGDWETVAGHLDVIENLAPELKQLYCSLGLHTTKLARDKETINKEQAQKLEQTLHGLLSGHPKT